MDARWLVRCGVFAVLALGCTGLKGAGGPAEPPSAQLTVEGVTVWASTVWSGMPTNVQDLVTPVEVRIENRSHHKLRFTYPDVTLVGASGFRYAALPPYRLGPPPVGVNGRPEVRLASMHPRLQAFTASSFRVPELYLGVLPQFPTWSAPWAPNGPYYQQWVPQWPPSLPTPDMLSKAMPEGVLDDFGTMHGYLYFQRVGPEQHLTLELRLMDAEYMSQFGTVAIKLEAPPPAPWQPGT